MRKAAGNGGKMSKNPLFSLMDNAGTLKLSLYVLSLGST